MQYNMQNNFKELLCGADFCTIQVEQKYIISAEIARILN